MFSSDKADATELVEFWRAVRSKERLLKFRSDQPDIVRGGLIILVIWGHMLEMRGFGGRLYFTIYLFHIPAFAMISGMFSKARLDLSDIMKVCRRLVLPLIIFQLLYFVTLMHTMPHRVFGVFTPVWILWFLFSLVTWKLLLPLVIRLPFPLLIISFVALAAGYIDGIGRDFSLSRTLVFFPAFLTGHLYGPQILQAAVRFRGLLIASFVAILSVAFLLSQQMDIRWLWGAYPYSQLPQNTPGFVYRAIAIVLGVVASVGFCALLPRNSHSLAYLGRNTMPVYALHGFPVIFFWMSGLQWGGELSFILATALGAVAIAFLMAWIGALWPFKSILSK